MHRKSIELSTLFGISSALLMIIIAISLTGNVLAFLDGGSLLIVVVGTFLISTAAFSFKEVLQAYIKVIKMISWKNEDPSSVAVALLRMAEFARKEGFEALEEMAKKKKYSLFLQRGIMMIVDHVPAKQIEGIFTQEIISTYDQESKVISILRKSAEVSPAMGLIGTIIGLIQMFGTLDDISKVGPAMGLALLTTFYGTILAYIVFFPLAAKIEANFKDEMLNNKLYLAAIISIAEKENPRYLESVLNSLLSSANSIKYYKN